MEKLKDECASKNDCLRNLEVTANYIDGFGQVYICANCKRYYIKIDECIEEVMFVDGKWCFGLPFS